MDEFLTALNVFFFSLYLPMVESQNFGQNKQFQPKETAVFVDLVKYGKDYINTSRI